jgi:(E)-4-hydroxy-3-methylbut-2-enyl-diphosphate synthase
MLLTAPPYVASRFAYARRRTREVQIGNVAVGGTQPIRVQSMTTTRTQNVEATLAQTIRLVEAGCEIVRITAPTVVDAQAIGEIKRRLRAKGIVVPLVADIHFSPAAALEAAEHVDKVRVNPGNFADQKFFRVREYTDEDYAAEIARIEERFTPLVLKCKQHGVAMRIGSNHGSLSDRIMNRHGDTPAGMVESALEFVRIARKHDYHDIVLSMKASNPKVMIQAYRLLVARMDEEGLDPYPLHLGVTEAGLGEDGCWHWRATGRWPGRYGARLAHRGARSRSASRAAPGRAVQPRSARRPRLPGLIRASRPVQLFAAPHETR